VLGIDAWELVFEEDGVRHRIGRHEIQAIRLVPA